MSQAPAFGIHRRLGKFLAVLGLAWAAQTASAATYTAADSAAFTSLLSSTVLGDTIVLNAGTTYTGTFILPDKGAGSNHITIQSSGLGSLPATGMRVNLSHTANMPKIRPLNAASAVIRTATSAHHFKLIGLEIIAHTSETAPDGISPISWAPVTLGDTGTAQDTLAEVPNNIVIDRCVIRSNSSTQQIIRGIALNSASTDITNSYISGFKAPGNDTQAICGWNGPGPFNIINNYLEAACENVMFGSSDSSIPNLVPSDIVIQKNHFFKPLTWNQHDPVNYAGVNWSIKNLFEIKNGRHVTLEGNIFENHWVDSQPGPAIVLTPANNGSAPWTVVEDVTFRNNIIRHAAAGPNLLGYDVSGDPSGQTKRITFDSNLFYDIGGTLWGGGGKLFQVNRSVDSLVLNHNTCFHTNNIITFDGNLTYPTHPGFVAVNNIFNREGGFGVFGSGSSEGNATLNTYTPACVFTKNVIKGGNATLYNQYPNNFSPTSLGFPTTWDFLQNYTTPGADFSGWKVDVGSAYDNTGVLITGTGSDGKDIGCDIDAINAATAGCISGVWPSTGITLEDFANSTDYWGAAYTGVGGDDLITGGKLVIVTNGSSNGSVSCGNYKHSGENIANAGIWTTGDFSGQGFTKLTFTFKNTGTAALTASNFVSSGDYVGITCKRISTAGNLQSNRALWTLANILFNDPGRSSIAIGETITVNVPFNSVDSWWSTTPSNQYGLDPANDRYIFSGFRINVATGNGAKNLEIDDVKIVP